MIRLASIGVSFSFPAKRQWNCSGRKPTDVGEACSDGKGKCRMRQARGANGNLWLPFKKKADNEEAKKWSRGLFSWWL